MSFAEWRRARPRHVRECLRAGIEPVPLATPFGASKLKTAAYEFFRRNDEQVIANETHLYNLKNTRKWARIDANFEARREADRQRSQAKRNKKATARGIPLRTRTDCSKMTGDEAKAHRLKMDRNKPSRRKSDPISLPMRFDLQRVLTDEELNALGIALLLDDLNMTPAGPEGECGE
jgi:hypothetical protein